MQVQDFQKAGRTAAIAWHAGLPARQGRRLPYARRARRQRTSVAKLAVHHDLPQRVVHAPAVRAHLPRAAQPCQGLCVLSVQQLHCLQALVQCLIHIFRTLRVAHLGIGISRAQETNGHVLRVPCASITGLASSESQLTQH